MIKILTESKEVCKSGIYKITCLPNEKVYIGSAVDLDKRFNVHFSTLKNKKHDNQYLQNTWNKYGSENFTFEVIEFIDDVRCLIRAEQVWLDYFKGANPRYGFNICPKAGSSLGVKRSAETRAKISLTGKGNQNARGFKHTLEARTKLALLAKGNRNRRGLKHTLESLTKMTLGRVKNNPFYYVAISPDKRVYDHILNLKAFCKDHNLDVSTMGDVARGKSKHHKGWQCQRVKKDILLGANNVGTCDRNYQGSGVVLSNCIRRPRF